MEPGSRSLPDFLGGATQPTPDINPSPASSALRLVRLLSTAGSRPILTAPFGFTDISYARRHVRLGKRDAGTFRVIHSNPMPREELTISASRFRRRVGNFLFQGHLAVVFPVTRWRPLGRQEDPLTGVNRLVVIHSFDSCQS